MSDTALKIGDNATVTFVFSEQICPETDSCAVEFTNSDITAPNGSLSTLATSDNTTWTGTFVPTDDVQLDDSNVLTLGTGYTDLAGNTGPAATTANYEVDTREPTVSSIAITAQSGISSYNFLNPGDNVSFTATFSETVILDNRSGSPIINTIVVGLSLIHI